MPNIVFDFISAAAAVAEGAVEIETILPNHLVAPAQVWVKAVNVTGLAAPSLTGTVYDPAFHEYFYYWEVRGKPLAPFTAPENMIPDWNDPNVANAQEVAFCLDQPGTYIIDLVVIDKDGNTAVAATDEIVIADADSYYPGDETAVVSFVGDFTGKPAGATELTSLQAIKDLLSARDDLKTRILFRRGEDFDEFQLRMGWKSTPSYIGAFGPSTEKPRLHPRHIDDKGRSCVEFTDNSLVGSIIVTDLEISGDWDAASETGTVQALVGLGRIKYTEALILLHNLDLFGGHVCIGGSGQGSSGNRIMVANCSMSNWRKFGMFWFGLPTDDFAFIGNKMAQHVDALNGTTGGMFHQHGPVRMADVKGVYSAMNDFFSRTGWSGADQPCLRLTTTSTDYQWTITDRNVMEGGHITIHAVGKGEGEPDRPGNHLIQRNLLISSADHYGKFVVFERGGTTIRGNYGYYAPSLHGGGGGSSFTPFSFSASSSQDDNELNPVTCYSNTVVSARSTAQMQGRTFDGPVARNVGGYTQFVDENNILHEPNIDTPIVPFAPIDLSQTIPNVTLRYKGFRLGFDFIEVPVPGGQLLQGETLLVPYADIHQRLYGRTGPGTDLNGETQTDQAYWQAIEDIDTRHVVAVPGFGPMGAHLGHFTVSFDDPVNVAITNTSGVDWIVDTVDVKLDRHSLLPPMDTSIGQFGQTVPLPVPANDQSAAWQSALGQFVMPIDFIDGTERPKPRSQGAVAPAG